METYPAHQPDRHICLFSLSVCRVKDLGGGECVHRLQIAQTSSKKRNRRSWAQTQQLLIIRCVIQLSPERDEWQLCERSVNEVSNTSLSISLLSLGLARHLLWADIDWRERKRGSAVVWWWWGVLGAGGSWQPSTEHFPIPLTGCWKAWFQPGGWGWCGEGWGAGGAGGGGGGGGGGGRGQWGCIGEVVWRLRKKSWGKINQDCFM